MIDNAIILLLGVQIFLRASFFDSNLLPTLDVAGASSLGFHDLSFFLLLLLSFIKIISNQEHSLKGSWGAILLGLFVVLGLIGVVNATLGETGFHRAARESRDFFLYILFFVVLSLKSKKSNIKKIVFVLLLFASITSILSLLQIFIGDRIVFLSGKVQTLNTLNEEVTGITRVGSEGLSSINLAFFICFASLLIKISTKKIVLIFLLLFGLFFSFNRGTWFSIVLALIMIFPFLSFKSKKRFFQISMIFLILGTLLITMGSMEFLGGITRNYLTAGIDRFTTIKPEEITRDGSTLGRLEEAKIVFNKFLERPIIGHGIGAVTQKGIIVKQEGKAKRLGEWGYVHNGYLYILFKLGIVGLLIYFLLIVVFFIKGIRGMKLCVNTYFEPIYTGSLLFFISIIPHSMVSPRIMEGKYIIVISISLGLIELINQVLKNGKDK